MADEKIKTLHPEGKKGVNIDKDKYEAMKQAIVDALLVNEGLTYTELNTAVSDTLANNFDGSIGWYLTTIKLDLEARNVIERIPKTSPQKLRLVDK